MTRLAHLNPLRSLSNKGEVLAWGMYDLANQSFTLLIITLLFPIYFKEVVAGDRAAALWAYAGSGSLALVVLLSPFVGAWADARGIKKRLLMITGVICAALTTVLAAMGHGDIALAMAIFMCANVAYQIGENLLAGFLPEVSTPRNIGRVSAIGWTMGYVGALVLLVIVMGGMVAFGLKGADGWAPFFVLAGVWFACGIIAPGIVLHEAPPDTTGSGRSVIGDAAHRLRETIRNAAGYRQLARFLLSFFVYGLGVQTVIYFAGLIAHDFGIADVELVIFVLQLTLTAGLASVVTAFVQDRIGARTTVIIYLGVWIATAAGLLALTLVPAEAREANQWAFWVVGNGVGFGLGGIGTSSRSMVGRFTPRHKTAEFFGLWGMTYKSAGVVGVLAFGLVRQWIGEAASMALLGGFFVVGLVLVLRVNEQAGLRAARRAQREHAGATCHRPVPRSMSGEMPEH